MILTEQHGSKPVVAVGRFGKGLVILNGVIPGYDEDAEPESYSAKLRITLVKHRYERNSMIAQA